MFKVQSNSSVDGRVYSIWLADDKDEVLASYNTTGSGKCGPSYDLQANEDIIGVYGVKGAKRTRISSFGFIVI